MKMSENKKHTSEKAKSILVPIIAVLSALVLCIAAFSVYYIFNNSEVDLKAQLAKVEAELAEARASGEASLEKIAQLEAQKAELERQIASLTATQTPTARPTGSPEPTVEGSDMPQVTVSGEFTVVPTQDATQETTKKPSATDEPFDPNDPNVTYQPITVPSVDPSASGLKLVALTYDDGPGKYTDDLLDYLKEQDVKATFFVINYNAVNNKSLLARMVAEGHVVGNHSNKHDNLKKMTTKQQIRDAIQECNNTIEAATGQKVTVMRPPGGNYDDLVKQVAKEMGMAIINWHVDTLDWKSKDPEKIMGIAFDKNSSYSIRDGSIVLMHDIYGTTLEATKQMIPRLKQEGYTFVTVPELLALRGGMEAGVVYKKAFPTN